MRARCRGFTLAELLIAVTVSAILANVGLLAWRPMAQATGELRDRARGVVELRLAVESLLQDLGGAATALPALDGGLLITREQAVAELAGAWDDGDEGLLYTLTDGALVRFDLALGTEDVLAAGLLEFEVTRPAGETHVALVAGEGLSRRAVELIWPE